MIIDTTKHNRCLLDLKQARMDKLESLSVSLSKEVVEVWYIGKDEYHGFGGFNDLKILKLRAAGAMLCVNPSDTKRACNNCGRYLEDTKKQQAFGRLYKCPGCSVAWWGKPTSLPANAETRNARRLTANMMKLVKELAPSASLKHDVRPLGCLNLQECRIESIKLTDLNASEKKRRAIIFQASQLGILNNADRLMAEELVDGYKSIQGNTISKISAGQCNHNWGWVGIEESCTHCGVTKKELLFGGGQEVEGLKEPQDLYDDVTVDDVHIESGKIFPQSPQIVTLPPGKQYKYGSCSHTFDMAAGRCSKCLMPFELYCELSKSLNQGISQAYGVSSPQCSHLWNYATERCKLCGMTATEALKISEASKNKQPEQASTRLIDLE